MQLLNALVADEVLTWKSHRIVQQEGLKTNRTLSILTNYRVSIGGFSQRVHVRGFQSEGSSPRVAVRGWQSIKLG